MRRKFIVFCLVMMLTGFIGLGPFAVAAKTMASQQGVCDFNIEVKIAFYFKDNQAALRADSLLASWQQGIDNIWTAALPTKDFVSGCTANYHFSLMKVPSDKICADYPEYHCIDVVASDYNKRGNLADATKVLANSNTNSWGEWTVAVSGTQAAHEVGHMMGLGEDYHYDLINDKKGWVNDNYKTIGPQSIMAQTWGDVAAYSEHTYKILEQAGFVLPLFTENLMVAASSPKTVGGLNLQSAGYYSNSAGQKIYTDRPLPLELAGQLIKGESDSAVYWVDPQGKLRWVSSEQAAHDKFGSNWSAGVIWFNDAIIFTYQFTDPI